jgi:hypothetical protein
MEKRREEKRREEKRREEKRREEKRREGRGEEGGEEKRRSKKRKEEETKRKNKRKRIVLNRPTILSYLCALHTYITAQDTNTCGAAGLLLTIFGNICGILGQNCSAASMLQYMIRKYGCCLPFQ